MIDDLVSLSFRNDMNILNYAIDKESEKILDYLTEQLKSRPSELRNLVQNAFGKNKMQAVH
jgi:hypothetical protein